MTSRRVLNPTFGFAGAVAVGCVLGFILAKMSPSTPPFLRMAPLLSKKFLSASQGGGSISYYTMPEDWNSVMTKAKRDYPNSLSRDTSVAGLKAKIITVPRIVDGRIQLFSPPEEEITFIPSRFAIGKAGRVVAVKESGAPWTGIERHVYHKPEMLDSLFDWLQKRLKS